MTLKELRQFPNEKVLEILNRLKEDNGEIPSEFQLTYEILEEARIKTLPADERFGLFTQSKEEWCLLYPDFKRISDIMESFKTNEMLVEYGKKCPPPFIHMKAIEVYKKCISFKIKFTKTILKDLTLDPNGIRYGHGKIYCISDNKVMDFLNEYNHWNLKVCNLWQEVYYLKEDFFRNAGYDRSGWKFYIKYPDSLKRKADGIGTLYENAIALLNKGKDLILKHDEAITLEYITNALGMSLHEREKEIAQMYDLDKASDEEYCYVYTLECELFVFYVGIAAIPKERFEQHIRGAFSDEAHLFKSKFIQKYHKEVKQNIVYEGKRKECKKFEKDYIIKFSPLGNMTEGGEG